MNKAYKYRIYPTSEQVTLFLKTFGCCRKVWNLMLADKIAFYKSSGKSLRNTPAQYKAAYPFLKEVDSLALANVQLHLQTAYANFFRDKKIGFPNFKSKKHSKNRYTTNNQNGTIRIGDGFIKLPIAGVVKAKVHRVAPVDWKIKTATVSMESDGSFYVSILFEYDKISSGYVVDVDNSVGLDYKSDGLYCDSDGNVDGMPHYYRSAQKRLAKSQRKLKHKVVNSNNYRKQQRKIAKIHRHVANQRKDYLHKLSAGIANRYDVVCVESLNMRSMANKGFGNGKATMDNGYGMFLTMLEYKLADRGKTLIKVDKWFPSSQLCSKCGSVHKLTLNQSIYKCECGLVMDRDLNAAINIRNEGLRVLAQV